MKIETCQFVNSSVLFKGLQGLSDAFAGSEPDCTWGDNNRSLVTADFIRDHLDNHLHLHLGDKLERQLKTLRRRILKIGTQMLVDLEH